MKGREISFKIVITTHRNFNGQWLSSIYSDAKAYYLEGKCIPSQDYCCPSFGYLGYNSCACSCGLYNIPSEQSDNKNLTSKIRKKGKPST